VKRVLLTGDWHCGSSFGLTPPAWQGGEFQDLQEKLWAFWEQITAEDYDIAILLGDLIDGGIDVIDHVSLDRVEQIKMASEAIRLLKAETIRILTGTPLHVNGTAEFEKFLATGSNIKVLREGRFEIEDLRLHARHTGRDSQTPYGLEGALKKESVRQAWLDTVYLGLPPPDLVLRGHVHRYAFVDGKPVSAVSVPCLQYPFSGFGSTISKWGYDMGVAVLEISGRAFHIEPIRLGLKGLAECKYESL